MTVRVLIVDDQAPFREAAQAAAAPANAAESAGAKQVKGRSEPVDTYRVLG